MEATNIGITVDTDMVPEYKMKLTEAGFTLGRIIILEDRTKSSILVKIKYSDILELDKELKLISKKKI